MCEDVIYCHNWEDISDLTVVDISKVLQRTIREAATLCNMNSSCCGTIFTLKVMIKDNNFDDEEIVLHCVEQASKILGKLLLDIAKGSNYDQAQMDDIKADGEVVANLSDIDFETQWAFVKSLGLEEDFFKFQKNWNKAHI